MKRVIVIISLFIISILVLTTFISVAQAESSNDKIRVILEYKDGQKKEVKRALIKAGAEIHYSFDELRTFALTLPGAALDGISHNPNVVSIEEDAKRYLIGDIQSTVLDINSVIMADADPFTEQVVPYGVDMVQARDTWDRNRDGVVDPGAPTGAGITICIIDSGFYTGHEDLQGVNVSGYAGNLPWNEDGFGHGSHVAGTIAAVNNNFGVIGVTPGSVDLYIVRVFGDDGAWAYASDLVDAANRCSIAGADIISMSLGGSRSVRTERIKFDELYSNGILSIAAAGNEGTSAYSYPASYDSVVSVAAIDSTKTWADFSQYNAQVELAAPGVGVLSTVPYLETNTVDVDAVTYAGNHIEYSGRGSASGALVDGGLCGSSGAWTGKVVLCERGTYDFYTKVNNVQTGGGVATLVYNNVSGNFLGTLGEGNSTSIIGLSLSQEDGQLLVANKLGTIASVNSSVSIPDSGYEYWDGTSMATPHVSAAAALAWSCLPSATNVQVRNALTATAQDLGVVGRDVYYGYGLVQAWYACNNLNPTAVELISFTATGAKKSVVLNWETATEFDNVGFNIYRASSLEGKRVLVNAELIPSTNPGSSMGDTYTYIDTGLKPGKVYYYWLEDVDIYGGTELHGPVSVKTLKN